MWCVWERERGSDREGEVGGVEEQVYIAHLIYIINTLNSSHDYSEI